MNDDKLIKLIKKNPSKGLSTAIDQYWPLVKTIVVRIIGYENKQDIEECVSDVFLELWKSIDNFSCDKGILKNYIISIARFTAINTYRRKLNKHELLPLEENDLELDIDLTNEVSKKINKNIIKETLDSLPYPDKDIFIKRYYLFESVKEIAASLNITPKAVENKLYRCKANLKETLIKNGIILWRKGAEMKKIHELLDDMDIGDENIEINEEMSEDEKQRILELTLNKGNLNYKKGIKSRFILPLAAAMTIVLSFAVVFAQGGLSSVYYKLFGENIKYVNEMGTVIDESNTSNDITLNIANMLGDENSFYIIFELIKENGESFKDSDYIQFDSLHLDLNSSGGYTWYQIEDDDANDNKSTFILSGNTKKKIVGSKLTLSAENFTEYSLREPVNVFDPYEFLINNNEYINQELIANLKKQPASTNDKNLQQEELDKINQINNLTTDYLLPWKYSNIFVEENLDSIYVDNIGFAENKLCIRFVSTNTEESSLGDVYFVNKKDSEDIVYNDFILSDEKDGVYYNYYIFDIDSMKSLENYDLKYNIIRKLSSTDGRWEVKFKADYKNMSETIKVNKESEIGNKKYTVKNIKLSSISLNIEMNNNLLDNIENPVHSLINQVSVEMKDGTIAEISGSGSSTNPLTSSINVMFKQPIDITKVEKVNVGNLEIETDF